MRRSKSEIQHLKDIIYELVKREKPMTVRQVYYRLVKKNEIQKTQKAYKSLVRILGQMRKDSELPYRWIADSTRWVRRPNTHPSMEQALKDTAFLYRRSLWTDLNDYVEIWLEKDALSGVIYEITSEWDVPLMVTRGYPSLSFLHAASDYISRLSKNIFLYYYGDMDPSGVDIPRKVESYIREFAPNAQITFKVAAVTIDQIIEYDLPSRPTKSTDSRSINFTGDSVELDSIPPKILRDIVKKNIE